MEIQNLLQAVKVGRATETLLAELEQAEAKKKALLKPSATPAMFRADLERVTRLLDTLPDKVGDFLDSVTAKEVDSVLASNLQTKLRAFLVGLGLGVEVGPDSLTITANNLICFAVTPEIREVLESEGMLLPMVAPRGFEPLFRP